MDEIERKVLRMNKKEIKRTLVLIDNILDTLEEKEVLTEEMVHTIQAESTQNRKVNKLLYMLQGRDRNAFTEFLEAIQLDYGFLAETLQAAYNEELQRQEHITDSTSSLETTDNSEASTSPVTLDDNNNNNNRDISSRTSNHSNTRVHLPPVSDTIRSVTSLTSVTHFHHTQELNSLYTKLKTKMTQLNMRELSFLEPQPVTFPMVSSLIDDFIEVVEKCYKVLDINDRSSLVTHLMEIKETNRKLANQVRDKEELRNKYADKVLKYENTIRTKSTQYEKLEKENKKLLKVKLELENHLKCMEEEHNGLIIEIQEVKKAKNSAEIEIQHLKEKIKTLENEKECLEQTIQDKIDDNEKMKTKLDFYKSKPKRGSSRFGFDPRHLSKEENCSLKISKDTMIRKSSECDSSITAAGVGHTKPYDKTLTGTGKGLSKQEHTKAQFDKEIKGSNNGQSPRKETMLNNNSHHGNMSAQNRQICRSQSSKPMHVLNSLLINATGGGGAGTAARNGSRINNEAAMIRQATRASLLRNQSLSFQAGNVKQSHKNGE